MNAPLWVRTRFTALVLGALLFINLLLFVSNEATVANTLARLPQPIATLIAGIVGLGTIAWQTRRGFQNLIASQEHRAELDRAARLHQAELTDLQSEKQSDRQRRTLAAAIHAELIALLPQVHNTQQYLLLQQHIFLEMAKIDKDKKTDFRLPQFRTTVFESALPNIGMLGPSTAGDVISVYSLLRLNMDPPVIKDSPVQFLASLVESLTKTYSNLGGEIVHVGSRLTHVQFGTADPGTLYDFRKQRDGAGEAEASGT
ncbi:hypothetical protein FHR70_003741 [Microvirga lupini]|uniref:Uncharacterized protein n=1 Tax=Microvirga lupini TaxID=420324 RepID=A0A7W4VPN6_9HYPH|nr:hypothetical protein [Microvirga lupini]MBB3020655.1 hypothetical protein [Microvirga lupini]